MKPSRPAFRPARKPSRAPHRSGAGAPGERPKHQDDFVRICGLPAVAALFARAPERIERLFFLPDLRVETEPMCNALAAAHKPFRQVAADELAKVAGSVMHGGVVAVSRPEPVLPFDTAEALQWAKDMPFLLALDGVSNPQNLGAIARTAAFFGLDRMVLSDHPMQAGPSDAAHRVAEGGLEWVRLYRAQRFPAALKRMSSAFRIVGTALGRGRPLAQLPQDKPVLLVLGNEERGLPSETLAACTDIVTLPGSGRVQSLNVSATAAICIHALSRPVRDKIK